MHAGTAVEAHPGWRGGVGLNKELFCCAGKEVVQAGRVALVVTAVLVFAAAGPAFESVQAAPLASMLGRV